MCLRGQYFGYRDKSGSCPHLTCDLSTEADRGGTAPVIESLARRPGRPGWPRVVVPAAVAIVAVGLLTAAAETSDVAGSLKVLARVRWTWLPARGGIWVSRAGPLAPMLCQPGRDGTQVCLDVRAGRYVIRLGGAGWPLQAGSATPVTPGVVVLAAGRLAS